MRFSTFAGELEVPPTIKSNFCSVDRKRPPNTFLPVQDQREIIFSHFFKKCLMIFILCDIQCTSYTI